MNYYLIIKHLNIWMLELQNLSKQFIWKLNRKLVSTFNFCFKVNQSSSEYIKTRNKFMIIYFVFINI